MKRDKLGDNKSSILDFGKPIKIDRSYADAYFNQAVTRYSMGDNVVAYHDYNKAVQLNPNLAQDMHRS